MGKSCFLLSLVLGFAVSADEIVVPNSNFDEIYQVGSDTITGTISGGGWTQGVGPECPIDNGTYNFSDATTDTVADIPGWIGYDRDGWIALGGTYGRDQTTGNLQGSIGNQGQGVDGSLYYLANGGGWGNGAGGLIVSADPLGTVEGHVTYTLSMLAKGRAKPVVLDLLAGGVVITPTSSVDPDLTGEYQEFSRTYDPDSLVDFIGEPLTICLGVGREATGQQSHFDNVSLDATDTRCPGNLSASGGAGGVTLAWQNGTEMPTSVRILRDMQEIASDAAVDPPTYTDADAQPGLLAYELIFTMLGDPCESLTTTYDACITNLASARGANGVDLTWTNNLAYDGIEIKRDGEVLQGDLAGTAEAYTDQTASPGLLTYTVAPTSGSCEPPTTVAYNACITDLAAEGSEAGVVLTWTNNLTYDGIEVRRNGEVLGDSLDGTAETYTDASPPVDFVTYTVAPTNGTCDPATVVIDMNIVRNAGFEDPVYEGGAYGAATHWKAGRYDVADPLTWVLGGDGDDAGGWNPDAADGFSAGAFAGDNTAWTISGAGYDMGLSQVLTITLEANTTYVLSVQVGNALYNQSDETAPYRLELLAGGVLLASDTGAAPIADTWEPHSLTYDSGSDPAQLGELLEIRLLAVAYTDGGGGAGYEVDFDEVELTITDSVPEPTIASISPDSGPLAGGTAVTITGTNFTAAAAATIGGQPLANPAVTVPDTITGTTPPGAAAGAVDVVVNDAGGEATLPEGFTYEEDVGPIFKRG